MARERKEEKREKSEKSEKRKRSKTALRATDPLARWRPAKRRFEEEPPGKEPIDEEPVGKEPVEKELSILPAKACPRFVIDKNSPPHHTPAIFESFILLSVAPKRFIGIPMPWRRFLSAMPRNEFEQLAIPSN
jgi:hypothetical protein